MCICNSPYNHYTATQKKNQSNILHTRMIHDKKVSTCKYAKFLSSNKKRKSSKYFNIIYSSYKIMSFWKNRPILPFVQSGSPIKCRWMTLQIFKKKYVKACLSTGRACALHVRNPRFESQPSWLFFINICVFNLEGYCLAFFTALELIEAKMYDFGQKCWW